MRYFTLPKQIAPWSLAILVAAAGSSVSIGEAIAPQLVRAQTATINLSLTRTAGETYRELVGRSEEAATAAVQRYFNSNRGAGDVSVAVVAENNGTQVPILSLTVSRSEWNGRPDPQAWATYLPQAESLLRMGRFAAPPPAPEESAPPAPAAAATPAQPPVPAVTNAVPTQQAVPATPQAAPTTPQTTSPAPQTPPPPPPQESQQRPQERSGGVLVCDSDGCRRLE